MPSIIDRYLIREITLSLLATVLILLAIVLSHRLAGYLGKAANGLLARDAIFQLVGLQSLYFLVVLIPLAFLLGVMLTLGRLYRDHEMAALAACGYGPLLVYRAVFMLAVPLAVATAGLSLLLVPATMELQFELLAKARKEAEVSMFMPGTFREALDGQYVIYVGALDEKELKNVFIQHHEPDGDISIITGMRGRHQTNDDDIRHIVLDHGYRYRGQPGQRDYEILSFKRALIRIDTTPPRQSWKHREAIPSLHLLASNQPIHVAEFHMRLNSPIGIVLIALWAPPLARVRPREGRYGRIVAAMLIYAIGFNLVGIGESWLSHGVVSTHIGLWWVHGLFLLLGLSLLLHQYVKGQGLDWLRRILRQNGCQ